MQQACSGAARFRGSSAARRAERSWGGRLCTPRCALSPCDLTPRTGHRILRIHASSPAQLSSAFSQSARLNSKKNRRVAKSARRQNVLSLTGCDSKVPARSRRRHAPTPAPPSPAAAPGRDDQDAAAAATARRDRDEEVRREHHAICAFVREQSTAAETRSLSRAGAGETAVAATRATRGAAAAAAGTAGGARRSSRAPKKRRTSGRKRGRRADVVDADGSTNRENVKTRNARQRDATRKAASRAAAAASAPRVAAARRGAGLERATHVGSTATH